jgi:cytochrome b561
MPLITYNPQGNSVMNNYWNTEEKFGCISKWLHWTLATLIGLEFLIIGVKEFIAEFSPNYGYMGMFLVKEIHKPLGILILILGVISLIWYTSNVHPALPNKTPIWQKIAARVSHILLYFGILAMPISGIIMSAGAGYPANFFHLTTVTFGFHKNPDMAQQFFNIHELVAGLLGALILIHILAAIKHHCVDKNNVLKRMLRD